MKRIFSLLPFMAVLMMTACSELSSDPQEPYILTVDKSVIESDGKDVATFTITDANGLVLTDADHIRNTSFHIEETGEWRSGVGTGELPNVFTSIEDGTYTVTAMYGGQMCENEVLVRSQNRSKYEKFHKNVAIYRLTGTWCQFCPYMTEALSNINEYTKDHSIVMEFHNSDEYSLSYNSTMDMAAFLLGRFGTSNDGYPYCIYSITEGSGKRTVMDIQKLVRNQLYANPAKTGIKAASSMENGKLTVNAAVTASVAGKYDLGIAVLRDGCVPTSSNAFESVYNDVVTMISGNFFALSNEAFQLGANEEKGVQKVLESDVLKNDNCRVVLFTLTEANGKAVIDNVVSFGAGKSVEYRYN